MQITPLLPTHAIAKSDDFWVYLSLLLAISRACIWEIECQAIFYQ